MKHSRFPWVVTGLTAVGLLIVAIAESTTFSVIASPPCPVSLPIQKAGWEDPNMVAGKYLGNKTIVWGESVGFTLQYCFNDDTWMATVNGYQLPSGADVNDVTFTWTPDEGQVGDHYLYFHLVSSKGDRLLVSDVGTFCVRVHGKPHEFIGTR